MRTKLLMIVCLGLALLFGSCRQHEERRTKAPTRVKTEVIGAATGSAVTEGSTYVGVVEENEATAVSFTGMGVVRKIHVTEGQHVSRGQLLAEMDDTQARNMLAAAEAQNRQAEDALARYSQLHEQGSMTDAQWVEIQSKVEQARSQLAIARKNVSDCRLIAPVSGTIGRRNVNAGETAMPSQSVVTILDISQVKVRFSVPEADMAAITPSTPTLVSIEAIGREYHGGRIEKGVQADALTHTYDVRVRVDNRERALLPGMVAKVRVAAGAAQSSQPSEGIVPAAPTLPLTAVQRRADGSLFVWTIGSDSAAHRTAVTIGESVGNRIEVLTGIAEGQHVVTEGYQKLSEGTKVAEQ